YDILHITLELKNNSNESEEIDTGFNVYADDYLCKLFDSNDDDYWDEGDTSEVELFSGKKFKYELEYMIPKDTQNVKLYVDAYNYWYESEKQFAYTIKR
ncbi:MAG: hypothetical protein J1E41_04430, partial [Ruminococcus sp.]|nr:hypothetical protein [Ruminococcus sp.]